MYSSRVQASAWPLKKYESILPGRRHVSPGHCGCSKGAGGVPAVDAIRALLLAFCGQSIFDFELLTIPTDHTRCRTADPISTAGGSIDDATPLIPNPIEEKARETRGGEAATDRALRTKPVRAQETSPDPTIAEETIVHGAHALIGDGRTESVCPATADRPPAAPETTIAEFQSVSTAPLALRRRQTTTRETVAGTPITAPSHGTHLLPRAAARPLRHQPGRAQRPRSPRNKPPLTKSPLPTTTAPSSSSNRPERSRSRNRTTPPRGNSPRKRTPWPTRPSSSNTTNRPNPACRPRRPRGASTSSRARRSSRRCRSMSARAGCLDGSAPWWISRLSIPVAASSMRCCSFGTRRRGMSGGARRAG